MRQVGHENPAIALQDVNNGATAFLVEHVTPETGRDEGGESGFPFRFLFISFPFVCPEPVCQLDWGEPGRCEGAGCSGNQTWLVSRRLSLEHHATLHDEADLLHHRDVRERITLYRDNVGILASFDAADVILQLHQFRAMDGCSV